MARKTPGEESGSLRSLEKKLANHMCDAENKTIMGLPSILMRIEGRFVTLLTKNTFEWAGKFVEFDQRHD